jgi:phage terminase large subunit-like protein
MNFDLLPPGTLELCDAFLERAQEARSRATTALLPLWTPQPGPQTLVWNLDCDEILYGGAAGGGKSMIAAALPLQFMNAPRARLLVLRRNTGDLAELIDLARSVFITGHESGSFAYRPAVPSTARYRETPKHLLTIDGDRIRTWFNHCDKTDDWQIYIGHAFDKIVFDEVVQFEEVQYVEISSRVRGSVPGVRRGVLALTNPPKPSEPGNEWVRRRWGPWLSKKWRCDDWQVIDAKGEVVGGKGLPERRDEDGESAAPAASGQILYVGRIGDEEDDRFSTEPFSWWMKVQGKLIRLHAQTRTYVRSLLSDNPALLEGTPNYAATLAKNDPVRTKQLLGGDWEASYDKGEMFRRTRFEAVRAVPSGSATWARAWDFAGTKPNEQNKDPDWTVGLRGCRHEDGYIYLAHGHAMRDEPGEVEAARGHYATADGPTVKQLYPRDPAEAGKTVVNLRVAAAIDAGTDADMVPATRNVLSKAGPVSAAAHPRALGKPDEPGNYGKIRVVQGDWNEPFFDCVEGFPKAKHDDWVSALADLYNYLMSAPGWTPPVAVHRLPAMRLSRGRGFG